MLQKENNDYEKALQQCENYYKNNLEIIVKLLHELKNKGRIVLWGAGLKGKAFLKILGECSALIDFVIDTDKEKQGKTLQTGQIIKGMENIEKDMTVLIVNEKYYPSICVDMITNGYDIKAYRFLCLDYYINNDFTLEEVKNNSIWERKRYYD